MSASIELRNVTKAFGTVRAVNGVSITVKAGEFLTLLGPSGCGKTTLLRLIAGFALPDSGRVLIGDEDVTHLPPHRRNVNQVFQSYALFPHLNVHENVAFGLRRQGLPASEIERRVGEALELVALADCGRRKPHQLSGGQQQRVALARALAPRPAVLLLDEPLSALDARLRQAMQIELKRLQRQIGTTFIFVTHDQDEALTMSDRIALIHEGKVEQCAAAQEIYLRPATAFAAQFVGQTNLLEAELIGRVGEWVTVKVAGALELRVAGRDWPEGVSRAQLSIRPEKLHLSKTRTTEGTGFAARVEEVIFRGAVERLVIAIGSSVRLAALVPNPSAHRERMQVGDEIWCAIHADDVVVVPEDRTQSFAR